MSQVPLCRLRNVIAREHPTTFEEVVGSEGPREAFDISQLCGATTTDKHTYTHVHTYIHTYIHTYKQTHRHTDTQNRHSHRNTHRTETQTHRQHDWRFNFKKW